MSSEFGLQSIIRARTIATGEAVTVTDVIRNSDRAAGAMLSGAVAKKHGHDGLPDDTIVVKLTGTAGQSFGAWLAAGVTLDLAGHGNDYVGKGLSGGKLIIRPSDALKAPPHRITLPDAPVPYNGGLEARYLPNAPYVTQQIDALVSTGRAPQAWWKQAS